MAGSAAGNEAKAASSERVTWPGGEMGNCCSGGGAAEGKNNVRHKKATRVSNWSKTGVIGLRRASLKVRCLKCRRCQSVARTLLPPARPRLPARAQHLNLPPDRRRPSAGAAARGGPGGGRAGAGRLEQPPGTAAAGPAALAAARRALLQPHLRPGAPAPPHQPQGAAFLVLQGWAATAGEGRPAALQRRGTRAAAARPAPQALLPSQP